MPQQSAIPVHAYDSDANLDGRTDDEQEHQEPPQTREQSRVCLLASTVSALTCQDQAGSKHMPIIERV